MTEAEAREIVDRYEDLVQAAAATADRLSSEFRQRRHDSHLVVQVEGGEVSVIVRWPEREHDGVAMEQYAVRFPVAFLSDDAAVKAAKRRARPGDFWGCDIGIYL